MKALKKLLVTVAAIAGMAFLPGFTMTAKAAPTTYTLKYVPAYSEWRAQPLANWDEGAGSGNVGYLEVNVKDGDVVIVQGGSGDPALNLKFSASLSNFTVIAATNYVTIESGEITDAYVLKGSVVDLKGKCKNVYVYDNSVCNVRQDADLIQFVKSSSLEMNVLANGTVARCQFVENGNVTKDLYSFAKDTFRVEKGALKTAASSYSTTGTAASASGKTQTTNGAAVSPKTGESSHAIWLFAIAVICLAGAFASKKKFA